MYLPQNIQTAPILDLLEHNSAKAYVYNTSLIYAIKNQKFPLSIDILSTALKSDIVRILKMADYTIHETNSIIKVSKENKIFRITIINCIDEYFRSVDFTINGVLADKDGTLLGKSSWIEDMNNSVIRLANKNTNYLQQHKIKKLQAIRLLSELKDFTLDPALIGDIRNDPDLTGVSPRLIANEIDLILTGENVRKALTVLQETSLLKNIFPQLDQCVGITQNQYHTKDVFNHIVDVVCNTEATLPLRLAALFHDICKPECKVVSDGKIQFTDHDSRSAAVCRKLLTFYEYDPAVIDKVTLLIKYHMKKKKMDDAQLLAMISECTPGTLEDIFKLQFADNAATLVTNREGMYYNQKRVQDLLSDISIFE